MNNTSKDILFISQEIYLGSAVILTEKTKVVMVSACSTFVEHSQQEDLQSAVASGTSNPQLGGEPEI
jgi:hypothetical protein